MDAMAKFEIGGQLLEELSKLAQETLHWKYRPDFPLTFSASSEYEIWPFPGFGRAKDFQKCLIKHAFLRAVVREYMVVDNSLGRFHLTEEGAFKSEEKRVKDMFIKFECGLRFQSNWKPLVQLNKTPTREEVGAAIFEQLMSQKRLKTQ